MSDFEQIWQVMDARVSAGRVPGYVGAVRLRGRVEIRAAGATAVGSGAPMREDTLFRIASVTKPIGGALTLSLVQDGVLAVEDEIARWLPEASSPRVLEAPDAELDRTVPARRPITVRHLLTSTAGWGVTFSDSPLRAAMLERGVHPGPIPVPLSADEYAARVCALPLAFQPGEGWLYDTPIDLLGVVLARAAGRPLSTLVEERIAGPLGMGSTAFWAADPRRLATAYMPRAGGLELLDPPDGAFARPPAFESLGGGLVSSAPDLLRCFCALADGGAPVLTPASLALMTSDALTEEQRANGRPIIDAGSSWGLATGVDLEAARPGMAPGRWGWTGGTGTAAYVDPTRDTVGVILTQRGMAGPQDGLDDFWAAVAEQADGMV